jgi:membrane protein DedA with SNARE-associated domain
LESFLIALTLLFLVSLVSNATPFFGASYTLIATTELVAIGFNLDSFTLIVFVTALGATIGKIVIYAGARGLSQKLQGNKNVKLLGRWLGKSGFYLALFLTALIPVLPLDDYVYLGAGANKARLAPMLGVTFLAKLSKSAFEILLEFSGIGGFAFYTNRYLGLSRLDLSIAVSIGFIVLGVVIYKLDWDKWINLVRGHGYGNSPKASMPEASP